MRKITLKTKAGMLATLVVGVAAVGTTSFLPVRSAAAADDKSKNVDSKDLQKPLKAAKDALDQKKWDEVIAKVKEAEASPKKTPYDEFVINQFAMVAYSNTGDIPDLVKSLEVEVDGPYLEKSELPKLLKATAQYNYQLKDYDQAIKYGKRSIDEGYGDDDINQVVGQAYYLKGDWKNTLSFEEGVADSDIKAGRTPKELTYQLALSACSKLNDVSCENKQLEKLVTYYPKQEYWSQLLSTVAQDKAVNTSDRTTLQLYRLMSEVDALTPSDYNAMAQLAMDQGSPGEAQHILEKGTQKGVFSDARLKEESGRLLATAKKAAATDEASLPKSEKDAEAASTGQKDIGVGFAYLGYGQYDKASDLLAKGLSKGGVKSEPDARLLLGIAQLKAGHKDQAVQTFQAVKGDPALERLASLWSLHAKQV